MIYFVYILRNPKGSFYIGYTNNLKRRLTEHQNGGVYTTRRMGGPWKLIYFEAGINRFDAIKRERFLKTGPGRHFFLNRLKNFLQPEFSSIDT
ncbi:MAG: GIY-YIG nuclease family protein [Candidatus Uhrbacteria bacterium]